VALLGSGELRDNFGLKVACGRVTPDAARMLEIDRQVSSAEKGRAIVAGVESREVQVDWTAEVVPLVVP
jgi:hypothetical protein